MFRRIKGRPLPNSGTHIRLAEKNILEHWIAFNIQPRLADVLVNIARIKKISLRDHDFVMFGGGL